MSHNNAYDHMCVVTDVANSYWRLDQDSDAFVDLAWQQITNSAGLSATDLLPATNNNGATSFDGTDDFIQVGSASMNQGVNFPDSNFLTVEAWIKPAADQSASDVIGIAQKPGAYGIYLAYGQPTFFIESDGDTSRTLISSGSAVSTSSVYHIVGVYKPNDGSGHGHLYLYVNNSLVANATCAYQKRINQNTASSFVIGSWDTSTLFFNGLISNVALYDDALDATAIGNHYTYAG